MTQKSVIVITSKDERIPKVGLKTILSKHLALTEDFRDGGEHINPLVIRVNAEPRFALQGTGDEANDLLKQIIEIYELVKRPPAYAVILSCSDELHELYQSAGEVVLKDAACDYEFQGPITRLQMVMSEFARRFGPGNKVIVYAARIDFPPQKPPQGNAAV